MNLKTFFLAVLLASGYLSVFAQKIKESIKREFDAPGVLYVANVNGKITVETWKSNKVLVEVSKTIYANSKEKDSQAREQLKLAQMNNSDTLIIYIRGLGRCFCKDREGGRDELPLYHYRFDDWDWDYDFNFDFKLKVPASTSLILSTINDGDITVRGSEGVLYVRNINGSIRLKDISGAANVSTINGDVDIDYKTVPAQASRFYTLNGDINANFSEILNAELGFKSYNGDLYTNIENITYLPVKIEKSDVSDKGGTLYKIGEYTKIKVRNGGVLIDFETFNGDVIVKDLNKQDN